MRRAVLSLSIVLVLAATACAANPQSAAITRAPAKTSASKHSSPTGGSSHPTVLVALESAPPVSSSASPPPPAMAASAPVAAPPAPTAAPAPAGALASPDASRDLRRTVGLGHVSVMAVLARDYAWLLSSQPTSPHRPQWMRDAAEAHVQIERAVDLDPARAHLAASSRRAAIIYYEMLLDQHPRWCAAPGTPSPGCADETLYYLALEQERDGDVASARKSYTRVLREWPRSAYVPSAHLALGELFFAESSKDRSKLRLAAQSYLRALEFPAPGNVVYGYAQLQLGHVHRTAGRRMPAEKAFQAAIAWAAAYPTAAGAGAIAEEARKTLGDLQGP